MCAEPTTNHTMRKLGQCGHAVAHAAVLRDADCTLTPSVGSPLVCVAGSVGLESLPVVPSFQTVPSADS